eukprot:TRINITY_DN39870_c0_g1_i1.p1 TRINITY_DN39870_c0_g1~~TRINITY_DN39870_c0_g1_i1.p1  ORF type:complete len:749 (+),score=47.24 TRINITY_DN39870_c0_g1_i1:54-2249(+)
MANVAAFQIAQDKFEAQSTQAKLERDVDTRKAQQAELGRSVASQKALQSQLGRTQADRGRNIALEQIRWTEAEFEDQKIQILLQGFDAIMSIFHNIQSTAAVMMGFTATVFDSVDVTNCTLLTKYVLWSLCITTVILLVHSVFVATLCMVDGAKLAYQGTRGLADVTRAFHGLMGRRSEVFWNFISGFVSFNVLVVFVVWAKLDDQVDGSLTDSDYIYGACVSAVAWMFPVARMIQSHIKVRRRFKIDKSRARESVFGDVNVKASDFELDVGPQSIRRMAEHAGVKDPTYRAGRKPTPPPSPDSAALSVDGDRRKSAQASVRFALPPGQVLAVGHLPAPPRGQAGERDQQVLDTASAQLAQAPTVVPSVDVRIVSARISQADVPQSQDPIYVYVKLLVISERGEVVAREASRALPAPRPTWDDTFSRLPVPDVVSTQVRFEVYATEGGAARTPDRFLGAVQYTMNGLTDEQPHDSAQDARAKFGVYGESRLRVVLTAYNCGRYRQQLAAAKLPSPQAQHLSARRIPSSQGSMRSSGLGSPAQGPAKDSPGLLPSAGRPQRQVSATPSPRRRPMSPQVGGRASFDLGPPSPAFALAPAQSSSGARVRPRSGFGSEPSPATHAHSVETAAAVRGYQESVNRHAANSRAGDVRSGMLGDDRPRPQRSRSTGRPPVSPSSSYVASPSSGPSAAPSLSHDGRRQTILRDGDSSSRRSRPGGGRRAVSPQPPGNRWQ